MSSNSVPSSSTAVPAPVPEVPASSTATPNEAAPVPEAEIGKDGNPLDALTQEQLKKKLDNAKKDLRTFLEKKKKVDYDLGSLESSIYAFEGSYLSDTLLPINASAANSASSQFGNIIRGYDSYLKAPATGSDRKRGRHVEEARESERIFSKSSSTYLQAIESRQPIVTSRVIVNDLGSESEEDIERDGRKKRRHRN